MTTLLAKENLQERGGGQKGINACIYIMGYHK